MSTLKKFSRSETTTMKMSFVPFTFNEVALQVVIIDGKEVVQSKRGV